MARVEGPPRQLNVVASQMILEDVQGRVLFPTPTRGPWLPFVRFAETLTTGGGFDPEGHSHQQEEVLNYLLEGEVEYEDDGGRRSVLGEGTVALLTARKEAHHNLVPKGSQRARWLSVVVRYQSKRGPAHLVQVAAGSPAVPAAQGISQEPVERHLVGPESPVASACGLKVLEVEFRKPGRCICPVGQEQRAIVYVIDGTAFMDNQLIGAGAGVLLEDATDIALRAETKTRVLLASVPRILPR